MQEIHFHLINIRRKSSVVKVRESEKAKDQISNVLNISDEYYKMNQTKSISELPYGMDAVYLKAVKPQSYIRYWFR